MAEFVKRIFNIRSEDPKHEDIRTWLIDMFDDLFGLELHPGKSTELELREGWGRAGTLIEEPFLIEARTVLKNEMDNAREQIERHLKAGTSMNIGVATDGVLWSFFILSGGRAHEYHYFEVGRSWADDDLIFQIFESVPLMRPREPKPAIPVDFVEAFKRESPIYHICGILLRSIADSSSDFEHLLDAWTTEYRNIYPDFDELCRGMGMGTVEAGARELHFRYAYYVIVIKMIAQILVLGDSRSIKEMKNRPMDFAVGKPLVEAGVRIVEVDENYSWVASGGIDDVSLLLREISNMLLRYDIGAVNEDVFRMLYEEIIRDKTYRDTGLLQPSI